MRIFKFLFCLLLTVTLMACLHFKLSTLPVIGKIVENTPLGMLPPPGKFLDPFHGFWQNAATIENDLATELTFEQLKAPVKVTYDERRVPHIFAENDHDLYFAQGYLTAKQRLWQMEFISFAAAGRLSEVIGEKTIQYDKNQRRLGMLYAAEKAVKSFENDPLSQSIGQAYTSGINAYINQLGQHNLPLEYKVLNYWPEQWSQLKSALLLKYMAHMLAGREEDVEMTNAKLFFGLDDFNLLFPQFPKDLDPVIPSNAIAPSTDSVAIPSNNPQAFIKGIHPLNPPHPLNGSNNWAVAGSKTKTGAPILCNDPHLGLNLPSIWHEVQLHTPTVNAYGVTIPGAPGIIIGFNKEIAWGVTNAGRDVKDWYQIQFKDKNQAVYLFDSTWKATSKRVETIKVRGGADILDTLVFTHHGPVVYNDTQHPKNQLALRWQGHDASNEMLTFYQLNRAQNYEDYLVALKDYDCPAQNFVFSSNTGDIAIWQQGKFPKKWQAQGLTILDGSLSSHDWQGYIPQKDNPHVLNPPRAFVSSANQHPTDALYPFYYNGGFEYYRNRRLNKELSRMDQITVQDMKQLQNDNYSLHAAEVLPFLLQILKEKEDWNSEELDAILDLAYWNFFYDKDLSAPSVFNTFWRGIHNNLWDEVHRSELTLPLPNKYYTSQFLMNHPDHPLMDMRKTPEKDTVKELVWLSFEKTVKLLKQWKKTNDKPWKWGDYKDSFISHMAQIDAFSTQHVPIGGNESALNAMTQTHGPSWRMIVQLNPVGLPEAWGNYPGGQSGNPGSPFYDNQTASWAAGEYFPLHFYQTPPDKHTVHLFKPKK